MTENASIKALFERKSVRAFLDKPLTEETKNLILDAGITAPSAGCQCLYTILDIEDAALKKELAVLCDKQSFIAKAPFALVLLADCKKWQDAYGYAGADARKPALGDLVLACCDALIAAQNMVVCADALGLGSCYIGDILENRETVTRLLNLDKHVFPVTMLIFGYPTDEAKKREKPARPARSYMVQKNKYTAHTEKAIRENHASLHENADFDEWTAAFCKRKYMSDFALELNRSVEAYLKEFS